MIPKISLQDLLAGIAAAALIPFAMLDYGRPLRPTGRELLAAAFGIALLILIATGCAPGPLEPLTPAEERALAAQVMAADICGARSWGTRCHQRAVRWYYKLTEKEGRK